MMDRNRAITNPVWSAELKAAWEAVPLAAGRWNVAGSPYLWIAVILVVALTRWPAISPQLYSFDSVNLALALNEFNPTLNQPQPPGYPVFVLVARSLYPLLGSPENTFAAMQLLISVLALGFLYKLTALLFSARVAFIACALFLFNPVFWYSGLTSPLRPHLAFLSILFAYFCFQAIENLRWNFLMASFTLGLAGGFRPELSLVLFPLWLWTGWRCADLRLLLRGFAIIGITTWLWLANLAAASGGFASMMAYFQEYLSTQTFQTSVLQAAPLPGWRRMVGRVVIWLSLGALPWLWAIPFGWKDRAQLLERVDRFVLLGLWLVPAAIFNMVLHSADPDHLLASIPVICIIGGLCLDAAESRLNCTWWTTGWTGTARARAVGAVAIAGSLAGLYFAFPDDTYARTGLAIWFSVALAILVCSPLKPFGRAWPLLTIALIGNMLLFFGEFPFPTGPAAGGFRGLASLRDAFLGGRYESSYARIRWTSERMADTARDVPRIRAASSRPLVFIWSRDGEPSWRKVTYYLPKDKVYVLDEAGDPGSPASQAVLWTANKPSARFSGTAPVQLPIPRGARLIWFIAGGKVAELSRTIPVRQAPGFLYSDLPREMESLRWGSFEFVPQ